MKKALLAPLNKCHFGILRTKHNLERNLLTSSGIVRSPPNFTVPRPNFPSASLESPTLVTPSNRLFLPLPRSPKPRATCDFPPRHPKVSGLQTLISYTFTNPLLAQEALTARGAMFTNGPHFTDGNLRLAIIGDIVLELAIAENWFQNGTERSKLADHHICDKWDSSSRQYCVQALAAKKCHC